MSDVNDPRSRPLASRRRYARIEPPPSLRCHVVGSAATFTVRDISLGGLSLLAPVPLALKVEQEFRLTLGPMTIVQRGRPVYCRQQEDGRWVVGIAFRSERPSSPTIDDLIDLITSSVIRFS